MAIERTISIIKPDAVGKNVIGEIYTRFEKDSIDENAVHGSDSAETAAQEIAYFFQPHDCCARTR